MISKVYFMESSYVLNLQASALVFSPSLQCFRHTREALCQSAEMQTSAMYRTWSEKYITISAEVNIAAAEQSVSCSGSAP